MAELIEVTSGLRFPEGPIAMPDGTVILVEMFGPRLTRVHPDGRKKPWLKVYPRLRSTSLKCSVEQEIQESCR